MSNDLDFNISHLKKEKKKESKKKEKKMLFRSYIRITYSAPVDEAKHKSGHLSCEDYHDDGKKLKEKFREKHKI